MDRALLLPLRIATHRLLSAGYMTNFDMVSHLFTFAPDGAHVASLPVVGGKVCPVTVQALEDKAKNIATCCS